MDDNLMKQALNADIPAPDENARKRAVNLALVEFETVKKESSAKAQGFLGRVRPMDRSNTNTRNNPMSRKLVYGGMATAMIAIITVGLSMNQAVMNTAGLAVVDGKLAAVTTAPTPIYQEAIEDRADAEAEKAVKQDTIAAVPFQVSPLLNNKDESRERDSSLQKEKLAAVAVPQAPAARAMAERKMEAGATTNFALGGMAAAPAEMSIAADAMVAQGYKDAGRDKFENFEENPVKLVREEPVSTFSIDVDTSSYAFVRNQLNSGVLPQKDAVRVEEMINYFDYDYALADDKAQPFKPSVTVMDSPWNKGRKLVHIGVRGYDVPKAQAPASNLVFLLDTSGSMNEPDKLPLLISSLKMLLDSLKPTDRVAIVTYAGSAGTVLEPTAVSEKARILAALDNLSAGGSTAGAEGIRQAYALAKANFDKNAVNRVILATDGDFNVGITNPEELQDFVENERKSGVFLSVFGFGQGNYNDQMMQTLAQNGNGVAAYIDTLNEARKVLVEEASSTLFPIAKDVKIQVEFNPATVAEYRLVGYETRKLNREDFNNDAVDAGDIGAGHTVTAIYEITPVGGPLSVDESRYTAVAESAQKAESKDGEYAFLKIRYKLPDQNESKLITTPIAAKDTVQAQCGPAQDCEPAAAYASDDVRFSVAVASFGQLLKGGKQTGSLTYDDVINQAQAAKGADPFGYRAEFINLVRLAKTAQGLPDTQP